MPALFEAYVTNLGKYNEGELLGEYLKFPTTPEEVQALLKRIGIDGVRYEEIFITDFDGDVLGLYDHLGEYKNIDELNHLACVISELDQGDLEKFEAVIDSGEYTGSVKELINLAQNLDKDKGKWLLLYQVKRQRNREREAYLFCPWRKIGRVGCAPGRLFAVLCTW